MNLPYKNIRWGIIGCGDVTEKKSGPAFQKAQNSQLVAVMCRNGDLAKDYTNNAKPVVIIMKTIMGYGVDFMMGTHKWHGVTPNDEQTVQALLQLEETIGDYS